MEHRQMEPDEIAHLLATNVDRPVRVYLSGGKITVPTEPYIRSSPQTATLPCPCFDAVVDDADVVDGGLNFAGFSGLHLPPGEWERTGLQKHWEHDDAEPTSPISGANRRLEIWASREDALYEADEDDYSFDHLEAIPEDSPLITEWGYGAPEDEPRRPPVPLSRPKLSVYAIHGESSDHDAQGFDRIEVGTIAAVEVLDTLDEWPSEVEQEQIDLAPASQPDLDYAELDALPQSPDLLEAVHVINRYAKQFDERASSAYEAGEGAEARVSSVRKKALYAAKTVALHRLTKSDPDAVGLEKHELDAGGTYWCLYLGDYAFHQPLDALEEDLLNDIHDDAASVETSRIELSSSPDTKSLDLSLDDALLRLQHHGVDVNDYLDARYVEDFDWGYDLPTTFSALAE